MENFTQIPALMGGLMIGAAATLLLWTTGRVAGISGILAGLLSRNSSNFGWRLAFIVGLMAGPFVVSEFGPGINPVKIEADIPILVIAGLLVGVGTRMGSGCTSGHGVCGIGRFSVRSIVATCVFMAAGAACVYVIRHLIVWGG